MEPNFADEIGCSEGQLRAFYSATGRRLDEFMLGPMGDIVHFGSGGERRNPAPRNLGISADRAKLCGQAVDEAAVLRNVPVVATVGAPQTRVLQRPSKRTHPGPPASAAVLSAPQESYLPHIALMSDEDMLKLPEPVFTSANFKSGGAAAAPCSAECETPDPDDKYLQHGKAPCEREKESAAYQRWLRKSFSVEISQETDLSMVSKNNMATSYQRFKSGWSDTTLELNEICSPRKVPRLELPTAVYTTPVDAGPYTVSGVGSVREASWRQREVKSAARKLLETQSVDVRMGKAALGNDAAYAADKTAQPWSFDRMLAYTVEGSKAAYQRARTAPGFVMLMQHDDVSPALGAPGTAAEHHLFGPQRKPPGAYGAVPWTERHLDSIPGGKSAVPAQNGAQLFGVHIDTVGRYAFAVKNTPTDTLFVVRVKKRSGLQVPVGISAVNAVSAAGQVFPRWPSTSRVESSLANHYHNKLIEQLWNETEAPVTVPTQLCAKLAQRIRHELCTSSGTYRYDRGPPITRNVDDRVAAALTAYKLFKSAPKAAMGADRRPTDPFLCGATLRDYLLGKVLLVGGGQGAPNFAAVNLQFGNPLKSGVTQAATALRYAPIIAHPNGHFPEKKRKNSIAGIKGKDRRRSTDVELYKRVSQIHSNVQAGKLKPTENTLKLLEVTRKRRAASEAAQTNNAPRSRDQVSIDVSQKWEIQARLRAHEEEMDPTLTMGQMDARRAGFEKHARQRNELQIAMMNAWARGKDADDYDFGPPKHVELATKELVEPPHLEYAKLTRYQRGDLPNIVYDSRRHTIVPGKTPQVIERPSGANSSTAWAISIFAHYRSLLQMSKQKAAARPEDQDEWDLQIADGIKRFEDKYGSALPDPMLRRMIRAIRAGRRYDQVA
jgi:hypothetical protein